jgi:hypothetical protein
VLLSTVNLALGKPAVASRVQSSPNPNDYAATNATDGSLATRWSGESEPNKVGWLYADLGAACDVQRVKVTWEAAAATEYKLQVSGDAAHWSTIKTVTSGDGGADDWTGLTGAGRYVRVWCTYATINDGAGYSIWELEVYGDADVAWEQAHHGGDRAVLAQPRRLQGRQRHRRAL